MMNFFEQQDDAHRNTRVMVVMFLLAVVAVVAVMDFFFVGVYLLFKYWSLPVGELSWAGLFRTYAEVPAKVYIWVGILTFALIASESFRKTFELRAGGEAIASAFGARRVLPDTSELSERQLLNVVEEMSIASGVRVPAVYILDGEKGINAFAAGFSVSDSIVAVTRGMLDALNRDELQGVMGHEFSHILNGDMTLNLRMLGILSGIVLIGSVGLYLIRASGEVNSLRATVALFFAGLMVCIIGFTGLFFARLIKAAVSREREFLADASSVQFTRNPAGIAGALDKIRAAEHGALIRNRYAEEVSHMFFGESVNSWFATHPPIEERIRRVDPTFRSTLQVGGVAAKPGPMRTSARLPDVVLGVSSALSDSTEVSNSGRSFSGARKNDSISFEWKHSASESANLVGLAGNVETARNLLSALPDNLRHSVQNPRDACAVVIALMLAPAHEVMQEQLAAARNAGAGELADAATAFEGATSDLAPVLHLPLIDLALPAIKSATAVMHEELFKALEAVIHADRRVSPHEFVVLTLMRFQLGEQHSVANVKYKSLESVRVEALWLLSLAAFAGCQSSPASKRNQEFEAVFREGAKVTGLAQATPDGRDVFNPELAMAMLGKLRLLVPAQKAVLVQALFAAATADGTIRIIEAELVRMVCAVLDCPLPPMLDLFDSGKQIA